MNVVEAIQVFPIHDGSKVRYLLMVAGRVSHRPISDQLVEASCVMYSPAGNDRVFLHKNRFGPTGLMKISVAQEFADIPYDYV